MRKITAEENPEITEIKHLAGKRAIVLIEGEDDLDVLEDWFHEDLPQIYFHDCGGKDEVKKIYDLLDKQSKRKKIFAIRDRDFDFSTRRVNKCYKDENTRFFILKWRNIENYVLTQKNVKEWYDVILRQERKAQKTNLETKAKNDLEETTKHLIPITIANMLIQDENNKTPENVEKPIHFQTGHSFNKGKKDEIIEATAKKLNLSKEEIELKFEKKIQKLPNLESNLKIAYQYICGKRIIEGLKKMHSNQQKREEIFRLLSKFCKQTGLPQDFLLIRERVLK